MMRPIFFVACATLAVAAGPAAVRGATGPDDNAPVSGCQEQIEERAEQPLKGAWRERLGDWLRRQRQRDRMEGGGYYLRSPLLYAFGPGTAEDCAPEEDSAPARAPEDAGSTGVPAGGAPDSVTAGAVSAAASDDGAPRAHDRCAALVVGTRTDSEVSMQLPLPQLGARDGKALGVAVLQALARGESVLVFDNEGRALTLQPMLTRTVAIERCA